ncbi:hypothetical protein K8I85_02510, partial [bacterium]|nr:hypothetical protein [bacterium]
MPSSMSFHFMESIGPLVVAAAIVLAVLAFRLYPFRDGGARALRVLRLVSIALLVALLLDPVLSLFAERLRPPRIAVL